MRFLPKLSVAAFVATTFNLMAVQVMAQDKPIIYQPNPDSPIGERNEKAPPETAQFDFVIGDWDVLITWTPPGGEAQSYKAKWHNHWVVDGHVVMQEWRGPYLTGTELRFYDAQKKQWTGRNIYVGGDWAPTVAEFVDGKMVVTILDRKGPEGNFQNRETYYDITADSWKMKSDRSYDEGKTWQQGRYSMVATRTK